jgi:hypothetical protein
MAEELALGLEGFVFVIEGPGEDRAVDPYHDVVFDHALDSDPNAPGRDKAIIHDAISALTSATPTSASAWASCCTVALRLQ